VAPRHITFHVQYSKGHPHCPAVALLIAIHPASAHARLKPPSVELGKSTTATCLSPSCSGPSRGNDIVAKVDLGTKPANSGQKVDEVCRDFTFDASDPVSPGETLTIEVYCELSNVGTSDLLSRTLCSVDPPVLEQFQDGKSTLHVYASQGSFKVVSVGVSYQTVPA